MKRPDDNEISNVRKTLAWSDLVIGSIQEAVVVIDVDGKIVFANDRFSELTKADRINLLGKPLESCLRLKPEVDFGAITKAFTYLRPTRHEIAQPQRRLIVELSITPLEKYNQSVIILLDVTENVSRIEELEKMNKVMIDRELRMIELKDDIKKLQK